MKKYELTSEFITSVNGTKLYRIRALVELGNVKPGDVGGFISSEENLSQYGNAWVTGNALVDGNAWVTGNALVDGNAWVTGNAWVDGNSLVTDNAHVYGFAYVTGDAWVTGDARVAGNAQVTGNAWVDGNSLVTDNAHVYGFAYVTGDARVAGNAQVAGNAWITGNADYATIKGFGRCNRHTTFFRCKDGKVRVVCGCFFGDLEEFRAIVKRTHGDGKRAREYLAIADLMKMHF